LVSRNLYRRRVGHQIALTHKSEESAAVAWEYRRPTHELLFLGLIEKMIRIQKRDVKRIAVK